MQLAQDHRTIISINFQSIPEYSTQLDGAFLLWQADDSLPTRITLADGEEANTVLSVWDSSQIRTDESGVHVGFQVLLDGRVFPTPMDQLSEISFSVVVRGIHPEESDAYVAKGKS